MQADYEKRLKDVEAQREQLLEEMETRESSLINDVSFPNKKLYSIPGMCWGTQFPSFQFWLSSFFSHSGYRWTGGRRR